MVVETLAEGRPSLERAERWLRQTFNAANLAIWNHSQSHPEAFNLQSTATALMLTGAEAVIGHVGDGRISSSATASSPNAPTTTPRPWRCCACGSSPPSRRSATRPATS